MKGKIKMNRLTIIGIIIVLIISTIIGYFVYAVFINNQGKNNEDESITKYEIDYSEEYNAEDYLEYEDVVFDRCVNNGKCENIEIKKINFKNLDSDVFTNFLTKQTEILKVVEDNYNLFLESKDTDKSFEATSEIKTYLNGNILSIIYEIVYNKKTESIKQENIINIDLLNKKEVTNEEILSIINYNYKRLAAYIFDVVIVRLLYNSGSYNTEPFVDSVTKKSLTKEELITRRNVYIERLENSIELDDSLDIYFYIDNNNIVYTSYNLISAINECYEYSIIGQTPKTHNFLGVAGETIE